MYKGKKVIVVLPAYNAALTLEKTYQEIPFDLVDEVILCDDASKDKHAIPPNRKAQRSHSLRVDLKRWQQGV